MTLNKKQIIDSIGFSAILLFTICLITEPVYCSIFILPLLFYLSLKALVSRRWFFYILISIFTLLPQADRYNLLPYLSTTFVFFLLAISLIYLLVDLRYKHSCLIMIIFAVIVVLQGIRGKLYNYDNYQIVSGAVKLLFYPVGFFFAVSLFKDKKSNAAFLKSLFPLFIIIGVIISFQIIGYHLFLTRGARVASRQTNILLVSLISALSLLYFFKLNSIKKIALVAISILYISAIFLTMQRSLFVAVIISLLLFMSLCLKTARKKTKTVITFIIIIAVLAASIFMIAPSFSLNRDISSRSSEAIDKGLETPSLQIRFFFFLKVYNIIKKNVLFGQGVGDTVVLPFSNQRLKSFVDNSYLVLIWKLGLTGFLVFASIFFLFIKKAFYIIKNSKNRLYVTVSIALLCTIIGHSVTGLACAIMSHYHFNFIWGAFIGIIYYLYDEVYVQAGN